MTRLLLVLALLPLIGAPTICLVGCQESTAPGAAHAAAADPLPAASVEEPKPPAARPAPTVLAAAPAEPRRSRLPQGKNDITFDDLKFDIEKDQPFEREMLTDKIEALDGKHVKIRGYLLPSFQQTGLTTFVLVRDNLQCCFGPGAALYDCVVVEMAPGKSTDFTVRPIAVEGTFTIREFKSSEGRTLAIYHLDGEKVN